MFKSFIKTLKTIKWKPIGKGIYNWVQILAPFIVFILTIILGVTLKANEYCKSWDQACVVATLIYTGLIFGAGLAGEKFKGVDNNQVIGICLLLFAIILCSISTLREKLVFSDITLCRLSIMGLYIIISLSYFFINILMIKANVPEKDELINSVKYCEGPIAFIFVILFLYACSLGLKKIGDLKIDSFFSGAIAFQMILSNIIWGMMDNSARIKKYKLIKILTGE